MGQKLIHMMNVNLLVICPEGEIKCYDGSCRSNIDDCPIGKTCPKGE